MKNSETMNKHNDCSFYDEGRCLADEPATCERALAYQRRQREKLEGGPWAKLVARKDFGGWRHYLEGKPIHCGEMIVLQAMKERYDDYGEYYVPLQDGVVVRYEASLGGAEPSVTLYADVMGHEFVMRADDSMCFRWPIKRS